MGLFYPFSYLKTKVYSVLHKTILYRLGFGGRVDKAVWEKQYSGSDWEFLYSEDEVEHYKALLKQINANKSIKNVLDIGCGEGVLYDYLKRNQDVNFNYTGIDISETAIAKALQKYPGSDFKVLDYDFKKMDGQYDLIIFNEVLYYFVKPLKMILKAINENLAPGGVVIISMCDDGSGRNNLIWKNIGSHVKELSHNVVHNSKGWTWNIKTIVPIAETVSPSGDIVSD
jgi:2-polyprenyl-3-methyl-5-hydroxy-6-metoxy-1,4-benzoquinol methylase